MRSRDQCHCGSGLNKQPHYDGYGIFLTSACETCWPVKREEFRADIAERYECNEPIDEET